MLKFDSKFLRFAAFDEDALKLVIEDNHYGQNITIQIGTLHIDRTLDLATEDEL